MMKKQEISEIDCLRGLKRLNLLTKEGEIHLKEVERSKNGTGVFQKWNR